MARRLTIIEKHRRWKWAFIAFGIPTMLVASIGVIGPLWMVRDRPILLWLAGAYVVAVFVGMRMWIRRTQQRLWTAYERCDWSRCLYCEYDLRNRGECGRCPECGEELDLADVRTRWKRHWKWKGS